MKLSLRSTKTTILILSLLISASQIYAQDSNSAAKVLWQKEFGCGEGISCAPHEARINTAGNSLFITGTSFRPKTYTDGKFWLWEIDQNDGNEIRRNVLKETAEARSSTIGYGAWFAKGLKVTDDGKIYTVGKFEGSGSEQSFMRADREHATRVIKPVYDRSLDEGKNLIWRMIDLPDSNFFLIGRDKKDKALVIKVDAEGDRLWKRTYEAGKLSFFSDGVAIGEKGDFVIVGWSSASGGEKALAEPTSVRILKCNAEGEKLSEVTFPGGSPFPDKQPQICQLDSGNFAVAYDKSEDLRAADHIVRTYNSDLELLWEKQIVECQGSTPSYFRIESIPGGDFVVANCTNLSDINVYKYDEKGNQVSFISLEKAGAFGNFSLACTKDNVFIVLPSIPVSPPYVMKVKIIAIEL